MGVEAVRWEEVAGKAHFQESCLKFSRRSISKGATRGLQFGPSDRQSGSQAADLVVDHFDILRFWTLANRDPLGGAPGLDNLIADDLNTPGATLNFDRGAILWAVVPQDIAFDPVAMACKTGSPLRTKQHSLGLTADDGVSRDQIVGVTMADGNADAVSDDLVPLGKAVFHPPAKEETDPVSFQLVVSDDGPL